MCGPVELELGTTSSGKAGATLEGGRVVHGVSSSAQMRELPLPL